MYNPVKQLFTYVGERILTPISTYRRLRKMGILGLNQRNAEFIQFYNPRNLFPRVDDKLLTKSLALKAGISVPELYGVIDEEHQISGLAQMLSLYQDFVIKPAKGSGGDGILVVTGQRGGHFQCADGNLMLRSEIEHHVSNILSGMYSLGSHEDKAMIEYRVQFDPIFSDISFQGVPDIRVVIFQGYPVMSMLRLPTRLSRGKANLHQGAIGVGINLLHGTTQSGVWHHEIAEYHPDTGHPIANITIPGWQNLLLLSASCAELTGLGYLGVDIVLDKNKGPMMLEVNARPGLAIQIANRAGLLPRLNAIKARRKMLNKEKEIESPEARVAFAQRAFL